MATQTAPPVSTVETSIRIIETLMELEGAGVSDLAGELDIPTSTAHDHLRTLESCELVTANNGTYDVSTRFLAIGGHTRSRMKLHRIAEPEVRKLARETGEHSYLMVEEFGKGVFLTKATGEDAFQLDTHLGKRVPLQTTALGKAIMAWLPDEQVHEIVDEVGLPEVTTNSITDREVLFEDLATVKERGYSIDDEERIVGVRCVAAPIRIAEDSVAAISVAGPKSVFQGEEFTSKLPEKVQRSANVIEVNMTYSA